MKCRHCNAEMPPLPPHTANIREWADNVSCDACIAEHERAEISVERIERTAAMVASGALQCDIAPYGTPWKSAVDANPDAWKFAWGWRPQHGNVFLHGAEGIGKTALARFMLWRAVVRGRSVAELPAFRLSRLHFPDEVFHVYAQPYVLLVDDLSSVSWTDKSMIGLKEILEDRGARKRCTLFTSQFGTGALHKQLAQAVPGNAALADSVMRRMLPVKEIEMQGNSLRREQKYGEWK